MEQSNNPEVQATQTIENKVDDSKVSKQYSQTNNQSQEEVSTPKTFTQDEFNDAMASVRKKTEAGVLKKYAGVDVSKYRDLLQKEEDSILEEQKKRGEFEKILKDTAEKKDQRINQLHNQLNSIKVDDAIISSSAKYKAISPAQISQLIKSQVRLNEAGDVEVVDKNGTPRYAESGELLISIASIYFCKLFVTPAIAERTTTILYFLVSFLIIDEIFTIFPISATDVPPNFITNIFID